jgi:hypothetical protein
MTCKVRIGRRLAVDPVRLRDEPITELVNGTFDPCGQRLKLSLYAPHLRLVFSEELPQLTLTRGIPKLCKVLRRDAINDD